MQNEFMAINIEFHERKDSPQIAIVQVGNQMAMEILDLLEFAKGVVERIETHGRGWALLLWAFVIA
ncbi:MAG: hypothetical protein HY864_00885 [Chloroflexi bacterium]|nr:hypothetical protein [Chloroflexota bacterium]